MAHWSHRVTGLIILLVVLGILLIAMGSSGPSPADNDYAATEDVLHEPNRYVGDMVSIGGTVVAMEPLTIRATADQKEARTYVVENAAVDVDRGDSLSVHGELITDNSIRASRTVHRAPWEAQYMYVVSFLALVWVGTRTVNQWTVDTTAWCLVSQEDSI